MFNKVLIALLVCFNLLIGGVILSDKIDFKAVFTKEKTADNVEYVPPKIKQKKIEKTEEEDSSEAEAFVNTSPPEFLPKKPKQDSVPTIDLGAVKNFAYLASNIEPDKVASSSYQMIIVNEADTKSKLFGHDEVMKMKKNNKIILADISFTFAEKYRWYWKKEWDIQKPQFLGDKIDNSQFYVKQWWHNDWWKITTGIIDKAIEAGYDGIVISNADTYVDLGASVNLRDKMAAYVVNISKYAKKKNPSFLILPKNGEALGKFPEYVSAVDGIIKEDLIYSSLANGISGPKNPIIQYTKSMNDLNLFKIKEKPAFIIEYISGQAWTDTKKLLKTNGYIGYSAPSRSPNKIRESSW